MEVPVYDTSWMNKDDKIISLFEHHPESAEERELYFKSIYDKQNKSGTSILFHIITDHSHVKWQKIMEMEKLAKDSKLHIRVHKLDSTKTQIIGFLAQKHLEETHINLYNKSYYVHASSAKECQN
jgi:hypothetical protein